MHPIERLRFVARAEGASQSLLVRETANALGSFAGDPQGLVTACRRIVSRQPGSGPLVWLTARALCATDPFRELWEASEELDGDRTASHLRHLLPDDATVCVIGWPDVVAEALPARGDLEVLVVDALGEGTGFVSRLQHADVDGIDVPLDGLGSAAATADLVLLESAAIGPERFLATNGSYAAAAVARAAGVPVWLVGGIGRLLPQRMWDGVLARLGPDADPWDRPLDEVPLALVDQVVGHHGAEPVADALRRTDCPVVPELFRDIVL